VSPPLVEARGLGRRRRDGWLLADIDLALRAGDRVALVGPSGSGKTLLLRALALLDPLDAGAVLWRGQPVADVPAYRRHVTYLHQRAALFDGTVEDDLREPFQLHAHRDRAFDRARAVALLGRLGRDAGFLGKRSRDLSGGEAQIVALVRAVQLDPDVLLLDEATSALDADTELRAEALIGAWRTDDRALVWVTHDADQTRRVTDRVIQIREGRV
jgi:putative ABC transport system ATP-binding protein